MGENAFGEKVRKLRNEQGLTMDELAEKLGISKSRISMWENNGTVPRTETLLQLANFFHVSTDYLLNNPQYGTEEVNDKQLQYLQRGLTKLDPNELQKAEDILSAVFEDIFNNVEEDDGI